MIQTQTPEQTAAAAAEAARLENNSARILAIQERIVRARQLEARYAQDTSAEGQEAYRRAQQLLVNLESMNRPVLLIKKLLIKNFLHLQNLIQN